MLWGAIALLVVAAVAWYNAPSTADASTASTGSTGGDDRQSPPQSAACKNAPTPSRRLSVDQQAVDHVTIDVCEETCSQESEAQRPQEESQESEEESQESQAQPQPQPPQEESPQSQESQAQAQQSPEEEQLYSALDDVDEDERLLLPEYLVGTCKQDCLDDMLAKEEEYALPEFPRSQWRCLVIDWVSEELENRQLCAYLLYPTMLIFDHFLEHRPVPRSRIQMIAIVAMWIAWKFDDDIDATNTDFFEPYKDNFPKKDLLDLEYDVFVVSAQWVLHHPTILDFVRHFWRPLSPLQRRRALFVIGSAVRDVTLLRKHRKSTIATATVHIAAGRDSTDELLMPTPLDRRDIDACAEEVLRSCQRARSDEAPTYTRLAAPAQLEAMFPTTSAL